MTIICWDGRTLAADKRRLHGRTIVTTTKIERFVNAKTKDLELLGVAGDASDARELAAWYKSGADPETFPARSRNSEEGAALLVIAKHGTEVKEYFSGPYPLNFDQKQVALGCADEGAYIAMACGKTAAEAVELVSRFNSGCGNGVDTLTFFED